MLNNKQQFWCEEHRLYIPIHPLCSILQQLNTGDFYNVYITLNKNTLHLCSVTDWAEATVSLTTQFKQEETCIEIGKFSITMLLHICEFALSMMPSDNILIQFPKDTNHHSIQIKFYLKYDSEVNIICSKS